MKKSIAAVFALGILAALPAHAQAAAGKLAISKEAASAIVKVDWDDWHNRWRSHRRWGSEGGWGEHDRWRSHRRWGSEGGWGGGWGEHNRWRSHNRWGSGGYWR